MYLLSVPPSGWVPGAGGLKAVPFYLLLGAPANDPQVPGEDIPSKRLPSPKLNCLQQLPWSFPNQTLLKKLWVPEVGSRSSGKPANLFPSKPSQLFSDKREDFSVSCSRNAPVSPLPIQLPWFLLLSRQKMGISTLQEMVQQEGRVQRTRDPGAGGPGGRQHTLLRTDVSVLMWQGRESVSEMTKQNTSK